MYPRAIPAPPMQISPTSPGGTGRRDSSSTSTRQPGIARPIVTAWSGDRSAHVAITVASVGPYVFTIRRPGRAHRSTIEWGHASPPRIRRRTVGTSSSRIERSVGTVERTVTRCSVRILDRSGPARAISGVAATSVAPARKASHISSTERSNDREAPWYTRSSGRTLNMRPSTRTRWHTLRCSTITPFGRPVEPEV